MIEKFYDKDNVVVRNSIIQDVEYLSTRLRKSDKIEIWNSNHHTPYTALYLSFYKSVISFTIEYDGEPVAMFGTNSESIIGSRGVIWMLGSDKLLEHRIRFIRHSKYFIGILLDLYPILYNWCDDNNKESLDWLKRCGAVISEPIPYGMEQKPFRHFYFERN